MKNSSEAATEVNEDTSTLSGSAAPETQQAAVKITEAVNSAGSRACARHGENWAVTCRPWGAYNTKHRSATLTLREGIQSCIGILD